MKIADDPPPATPEWLLTYGDLMSLLLTVFVMLVSMGELKQSDKFQGVADSLHEQFGYDWPVGLAPGELRPRNAMLAALALSLRSQRQEAMGSLAPPDRVEADVPVRLIRSGDRTTVGTTIHFSDRSAELSSQNQAELQRIAAVLSGKPHKIEVRGHAAANALAADAADDSWELAYRRARATMRYLIEDQQIDEARIRISTAGSFEPLRVGSESASANSRVEVFLLEEPASGLVGPPTSGAATAQE